jgi:hypothetical protein
MQREQTDFERYFYLAVEVFGMGFTLYYVWLAMVPESAKIEIRAWFAGLNAPFDVAAINKRAKAEMWSDVIDLMTFGVPVAWA